MDTRAFCDALRAELYPRIYEREADAAGFELLLSARRDLMGRPVLAVVRWDSDRTGPEQFRTARREVRKALGGRLSFFSGLCVCVVFIGPRDQWGPHAAGVRAHRTSLHAPLVHSVLFVDPQTGARHEHHSEFARLWFPQVDEVVEVIRALTGAIQATPPSPGPADPTPQVPTPPAVLAFVQSQPRQLVGTRCAICEQRIGSEIDARFCGACGCPVHTVCSQAALAPEAGTTVGCRGCGVSSTALAAINARRRTEMEAVRQSQESQAAVAQAFQGIVLVAAGVIVTLTCSGLLAGSGYIVVATGALGTGVGLLILGIRRARQE